MKKNAHKVSNGTLTHLTAGVRRRLSRERWGTMPREVVVMNVGVGSVIRVSFDAPEVVRRRNKTDPSRGPKSLVLGAVKLFSESDRLKEKDEVEDGEGVAMKAKSKSSFLLSF